MVKLGDMHNLAIYLGILEDGGGTIDELAVEY